jgi:hypothetical protein
MAVWEVGSCDRRWRILVGISKRTLGLVTMNIKSFYLCIPLLPWKREAFLSLEDVFGIDKIVGCSFVLFLSLGVARSLGTGVTPTASSCSWIWISGTDWKGKVTRLQTSSEGDSTDVSQRSTRTWQAVCSSMSTVYVCLFIHLLSFMLLCLCTTILIQASRCCS